MFSILYAAEDAWLQYILDPITILLFVIMLAIAVYSIRKNGWKEFLVFSATGLPVNEIKTKKKLLAWLVFGAILAIIFYSSFNFIYAIWSAGAMSDALFSQLLLLISIIAFAILIFIAFKNRTKNSIVSGIFSPPKE